MRTVSAALLVLAMATPAFAHQCPKLWQQVDEKLQTTQLADAQKARVAELRQRGEELHKAGQHDASEAALKEALELLK